MAYNINSKDLKITDPFNDITSVRSWLEKNDVNVIDIQYSKEDFKNCTIIIYTEK